MKHLGIKLSLFINYFVFAILLNSVGAILLQLQRNFDMTKAEVSVLEGFKDLPIAIASFFVASFLPKFGIRKGMMLGLLAVTVMSFAMPLITDDFWQFKLLYVIVGVSFAIIKISVFATIGLITEGEKEHSSLMSWLEGFFMVGVLIGNLIFSFFIDDDNQKSLEWLNVYYFLGALCMVAFLLVFFSKLDETKAKNESSDLKEDFLGMLKLVIKPLILVFVVSAFLFVLLEQSFQTWFPTFYEDTLKLPASMSVQAGSVLAGAFAIGRILAGFVLRKVNWLVFLLSCLGLVAASILINLPMAKDAVMPDHVNWSNAPIIVWAIPVMGLFLAPIYPTINSMILSAIPKYLHSTMSGLIVVFSALGGTLGSRITGEVFERYDGTTAFYMALIPLALLAMSLITFNFLKKKEHSFS